MNAKLVAGGLVLLLLIAIPLAAAAKPLDKKGEDLEATEKVKDAKEGKLKGLLNALQHVPDHVKGLLQSLIDGTHKAFMKDREHGKA